MAVMKTIVHPDDLMSPESGGAISGAGASSHTGKGWHDINWQKVHQRVRRLQVRMAKATQEKRWGKVKALQRLLTRSFSGKALAVKRVTENQGKRTAGVDGELWSTSQSKLNGIKRLRQHGYRAQPLRRIYIPKPNGIEKRPLSIPTMLDRAMQALYLLALNPIAETTGDPNSYGFRQGRSPADAIEQCAKALGRRVSAPWIWEADIRSCFDTISHEWLEAHIPLEKSILRQWLKAGVVDTDTLFPTESGVPQGGVISPVIANLTLDGLEPELRAHFPKHTKQGKVAKVNLVRFADDFIITGSNPDLLQERVKPLVVSFLRQRGLALAEHKTHLTHIEDGFDFLGQHIRKYNGKLLIKPSAKNVHTLLEKVRALIKANRSSTAGHLIQQLNPIIRGWALFHRHVVSKQTFCRVDHHVFRALWRWARRRHPSRSKEWVRQKYFGGSQKRRWAFTGFIQDSNGQQRPVWLAAATNVSIRRHIKVRSAANPYDPQWESYFEQRIDAKMVASLRGRDDLLRLWQEQGGRCPICHQKITGQTGWHSHHIVWKVHGGTDGPANRVLLHPNCHRQLHAKGLSVVKPRLSTGV